MKITLKNIGVLKNAELDLGKDLIVLCGPNNTGKTYAAYTVYAVNREAFPDEEKALFHNETKISNDAISELFNNGNTSIDLRDVFVINRDKYSINHLKQVRDQLHNVFASNENFFNDAILNIQFQNEYINELIFSVSFDQSVRTGNNSIRFTKVADNYNINITILINVHKDFLNNSVLIKNAPANFSEDREKSIPGFIINALIPGLLTKLMLQVIYKSAYIAPAERIAINLFSRQLSIQRNKLVDDILAINMTGTSGILSKEKRYPLPIRDSLEIAEQLPEYQKQKSEFGYLADFFEDKILGGKVSVSEYGEVQYRPNTANIKPIAIHLTASMVKSLSSLVFYFRHIARKGDFIIIDEPELNLHPDNQRKVARILARIVNAGFKVMISTHSDYIYRELNNQIMLCQDSGMAREIAARYKYDKEELLDYNKVGAYLFLDGEAKMLPVSETGFEVKTIDDVIGELNEASMEIFTSLH